MQNSYALKAIVIFHAPNLGDILHPFLVKEVKMFSKKYKEVHLICLKSKCGYEELSNCDNVKIHDYTQEQIKLHIGAAIPCFFNRYSFSEIKTVIKNGQFGLKYLKECFRLYTVGDYIYKIIAQILKKEDKKGWIIDSYWFSNGAYAAAKAKKKFPYIFSFTRAHSFEIDPYKNQYYYAGAKYYIQSFIDEILFISDSGRDFYLNSIINKYVANAEVFSEKCKVFRLGTEKKHKALSKRSMDNVLRIVSCSRIDVEKRVEMIADVIDQWSFSAIEWTHFGGGDTAHILSRIGDSVISKKINLLGYCSNESIHDYYISNPVDVFLSLSASEGVPVSMMEAQSYGIPIVATNVGGVSEIVNNENGYLLNDIYDVKGVINALLLFLPGDTNEMIEHKRENSYMNWKENYDQNINDQKLLIHIDSVYR